MSLEIVERSSGYWIVDNDGVAWDEPFVHLSQAIRQLNKMLKDEQMDKLMNKVIDKNAPLLEKLGDDVEE